MTRWSPGWGETRREVLKLTRRGFTARDISKRLDISTQAVYRHLVRLGEEGLIAWPPEEDAG